MRSVCSPTSITRSAAGQADAGPFDPNVFEDEFRYALRVLADSGRALEVNTRGHYIQRSFAGGVARAETRSPSAATHTTRPRSRTVSPKQPRWLRRKDSGRAAIPHDFWTL